MTFSTHTTEFTITEVFPKTFKANLIITHHSFFMETLNKIDAANHRYTNMLNLIRNTSFPKSATRLIPQLIKDVDAIYNAELSAINKDMITLNSELFDDKDELIKYE